MPPFPRGLLLGVWLLGTGLSTVVAWRAVGVVAGEVTETRVAALSPEAVTRALSEEAPAAAAGDRRPEPPPAAATAVPAGPGSGAGRRSGPGPATSGSIPPRSSPTTTRAPVPGSPVPTGDGERSAAPGPATASPPPSPEPAPAPAPAVPTRPHPVTYEMQGGTAAVRCDGDAVSLEYATPRDGYRLSLEKDGPGEIQLFFRSSVHESRLNAKCADGAPDGRVEERAR